MSEEHSYNPWSWISTLYFSEGLPYVLIMAVSGIMYKSLGISNSELAFYTAWLYLPWVIKPIWSPLVDGYYTKRFWIVATQFIMGCGFAAIAFLLPASFFFKSTMAVFWLMAFSSATHDIAADGFYIIALSEHEQSWFVGIRSTFYRIASIAGQGGIVMLAGWLGDEPDKTIWGWSVSFGVVGAVFFLLALYHLWILPKPVDDVPVKSSGIITSFAETFSSFFRKEGVVTAIAFLLLYRLGESQLVSMSKLFMQEAVEKGGLGMTTLQVGAVYGTLGPVLLLLGGVLGGLVAAKYGLKRVLLPMAIAMNLPNVGYVYLAYAQPETLTLVNICVAVEQFGYGFGFTAFMLFMVAFAENSAEHRTSHFSIMTGFMAMGMMFPMMASGWIQESIGYQLFFVWVLVATIPGFIILRYLPISASFGIKK